MTYYRILDHPELGLYGSATEAIIAAFWRGIWAPKWEVL